MKTQNQSRNKCTKKQTLTQMVKFTLFAASAGIIQVVSFTILNELTQWTYWPCYLIALVLSVIYNFTLNRRFTFKSATNVPIAMMKDLDIMQCSLRFPPGGEKF
jgi:putative flippase GtrA